MGKLSKTLIGLAALGAVEVGGRYTLDESAFESAFEHATTPVINYFRQSADLKFLEGGQRVNCDEEKGSRATGSMGTSSNDLDCLLSQKTDPIYTAPEQKAFISNPWSDANDSDVKTKPVDWNTSTSKTEDSSWMDTPMEKALGFKDWVASYLPSSGDDTSSQFQTDEIPTTQVIPGASSMGDVKPVREKQNSTPARKRVKKQVPEPTTYTSSKNRPYELCDENGNTVSGAKILNPKNYWNPNTTTVDASLYGRMPHEKCGDIRAKIRKSCESVGIKTDNFLSNYGTVWVNAKKGACSN